MRVKLNLVRLIEHLLRAPNRGLSKSYWYDP